MGVAHIRNCSAQPANPFSLPVWLDFRRNEQAFQQYKMYCQEALLQQRNNQPNTNFFTLYVKFTYTFSCAEKNLEDNPFVFLYISTLNFDS